MLNLKQTKTLLGILQTCNIVITWDSEAEAITLKASLGCGKMFLWKQWQSPLAPFVSFPFLLL